MRKFILVLGIFIFISIVVVAVVSLYKEYSSTINRNEREFDRWVGRDYIAAIDEEYWLKALSPFQWHSAYIFRPGTTRDEIESIIGCEDKNIPEIIVEGYTQILFVAYARDAGIPRQVMANIHGVKPYRFYVEGFQSSEDIYVVISSDAWVRAVIEQNNTIKLIVFEP